MPDQPHPNFPILGFAAGTPLLTPEGHKLIEQIQPGDVVLAGPEEERPARVVEEVFVRRQPILLLHLSGKVIRTTADHPFFVQGQGWVNAADLPGAKSAGEEEVVYHLNLGEPTVPDQPRPNYPIIGFVAGTPILTPEGRKPIEDIKPGDMIETQSEDDQADDKPEASDDESRWWENN